MAKNTLQDLRNHLFEMLEDLKEHPDKPADADQLRLKIEKAKAVSLISGTIIDTAKLQIQAHQVLGSALDAGEKFFPIADEENAQRTHRELKALETPTRRLA
jgi:hypothetical protein